MPAANRLDVKLPSFACGKSLLSDASCLGKASGQDKEKVSLCMSGTLP